MKFRDMAKNETRKGFYLTLIGTWAIIAGYAVLHDQYLVRINPAHFTEYHPNPLNIQNDQLLATSLAFFASFTPGLSLALALCSLFYVGFTGKGLYPARFYPEDSLAMLSSQTVQLTTYAAAILGSVVLLAQVAYLRRKNAFK